MKENASKLKSNFSSLPKIKTQTTINNSLITVYNRIKEYRLIIYKTKNGTKGKIPTALKKKLKRISLPPRFLRTQKNFVSIGLILYLFFLFIYFFCFEKKKTTTTISKKEENDLPWRKIPNKCPLLLICKKKYFAYLFILVSNYRARILKIQRVFILSVECFATNIGLEFLSRLFSNWHTFF